MSIPIYEIAVPSFQRHLQILDTLLDKAVAHAEARKIDPVALLTARLFPDMHPLPRQVHLACDAAKGAGARLAGVPVPSHPDVETTFPELKERIAKTARISRYADAGSRWRVRKAARSRCSCARANSRSRGRSTCWALPCRTSTSIAPRPTPFCAITAWSSANSISSAGAKLENGWGGGGKSVLSSLDLQRTNTYFHRRLPHPDCASLAAALPRIAGSTLQLGLERRACQRAEAAGSSPVSRAIFPDLSVRHPPQPRAAMALLAQCRTSAHTCPGIKPIAGLRRVCGCVNTRCSSRFAHALALPRPKATS